MVRDEQGRINLLGLEALLSPAVASGPAAVQGTPVSFSIESLRIEDGTLHWADQLAAPPVDVWVKALHVTLRHLSSDQPIEMQARMSVFSHDQNVILRGRLHLPTKNHAGFVEAFHLETELSRMISAELVKALPVSQKLGLKEGLAGNLVVTLERLPLDPKALAALVAQVRLSGGRIFLKGLGNPIEGIAIEGIVIDARAQQGRVELSHLTATLAGGTIQASGTVDHLDTQPHATFAMSADHLALESLWRDRNLEQPHLRGHLSGTFQGTAEGLKWEQVAKTLAGTGHLTLGAGVIVHVNILREVFQRLSIFPGLIQILQARLPEADRAKLMAEDTVLQPIDLALSANQGVLSFQNLRVATDTFELTGAGHLGLDGALSSRMMLQIAPALSAAIIKGVKELQVLTDAQGRLMLPVQLAGVLPRLTVLPDVQYVASRLMVTKGEELLGEFLQRVIDKHGAAANERPAGPNPP